VPPGGTRLRPPAGRLKIAPRNSPLERPTAVCIVTLIQGGNTQAALAQIKVAPSVTDVEQLRTLLTNAKLLARNPVLDAATQDQINALKGSRLHRAP
jgi:hypothetical protein